MFLDDNAINTARDICLTEGLLVGISSGASVYGAVELSKKIEVNKEIKIVSILPEHRAKDILGVNFLFL